MIEIKLDPASGTIAGYASTFGGPPDSYGDIVQKGCFLGSLSEHKSRGSAPLMLWAHNMSEVPIGTWTELREDDVGLFARGHLNLELPRGREVASAIRAKSLTHLSIGFTTPLDGRTILKDGTRLLKRVRLIEISVVSLAANSRARLTSTKSLFDCLADATAEIRNTNA